MGQVAGPIQRLQLDGEESADLQHRIYAVLRQFHRLRCIENAAVFEEHDHAPGDLDVRFRRVPGNAEHRRAQPREAGQDFLEAHAQTSSRVDLHRGVPPHRGMISRGGIATPRLLSVREGVDRLR
jgi:hypothetical protein